MTLKQALWEIVRDENIIITNQNIDWLLDRASKKATGDAQALKESILERKRVIEENIPSALTNEEKVSEKDESNEELFKQALVEGLNRCFDRDLQIAEMTETINDLYGADAMYYGVDSYGIATALYNAGYRKQSEGEWIKHCNTYECSVCKEELFIEYAEDYDAIEDWNLHFCPNCGAKMKGGE